MKSISLSTDIELIKAILTRDNIYDSLVYDGSPTLSQYAPMGLWFVLCQNNMIAGLINLEPMNNVMWQSHIFIFEQYRGNDSYRWGKLTAQFMQDCLGAKKLLGFTPYEQARRWAERVGFSNVAILEKSILKNGVLLDQYMMEMDL